MSKDTSVLPFNNGSFNTVSFVASLNHIPEREKIIKEVNRILTERGRVIITVLNPLI